MRQPLAERLATFDGKVRHISLTSVVNQNLHAKVEGLNSEIARRINELQAPDAKVWQLQCNWKSCADGHVRFMWCSRIALEQTDASGFAMEREGFQEQLSSVLTRSGVSEPFDAPVASKWDGSSTPCDGSIFHIPLPGMTSFREPTW